MKKIFSLMLLAGLCLFGVQNVKADAYVAGTFNSWNPSNESYKMVALGGAHAGVYALQLSLSEADEFKIVDNGWYGVNNLKDTYSELSGLKGSDNDNISVNSDMNITLFWDGTNIYYCSTNPENQVYSVAGSSAAVFGAEWSTSTNDMTFNSADSTFTITMKNVTLSSGTVKYLVLYNHSYDKKYGKTPGGADAELVINAAGKYDVTFTFDWVTREVSASAVLSPSVSLAAPSYAAMNEEITLVPTPANFAGTVSYEYFVSIDGGDWTSLGSTATYIIGNHSYSFKVVASSDQSESATSDNVDVDLYTFTIAGIEALCGSNWNQADANNDMTYSEGKYHWSNALVFYPGSGNYGFQVVKNHAWAGVYPSGHYDLHSNYKFESGRGYYSVNIEYTSNPEGIEVSTTYLYPAIVKLASNNNNWDWASSPVMEWNDAKTICSASKVLETGLIPDSFKVVVTQGESTKWFGADGTMNRGETPWRLYTNTGNLRVCKDVNGEYGFAFNLNDTNIAVTYPKSFTRTVTAERAEYYQTLCVPFDATISGAKAYAYSEVDGAYVKLTEVSNLTAGEAYLIMPNGAGTITVTAANPANETAAPAIPTNGFIGNLGETVELFAENSWSKYVLKNNEFHMIEGTASIILESTKAYLHLASPVSGSAPSQLRIVLEENNTTDINSLKAEGEAVKFFENGQLYILRDGVVYDATGRAVK